MTKETVKDITKVIGFGIGVVATVGSWFIPTGKIAKMILPNGNKISNFFVKAMVGIVCSAAVSAAVGKVSADISKEVINAYDAIESIMEE